MFSLRDFEYSIAPMKWEMDREVYDTLILDSETVIETNKTGMIRKWYRPDTDEGEGTKSTSAILSWLNVQTQK